jgi:hypothetical protein
MLDNYFSIKNDSYVNRSQNAKATFEEILESEVTPIIKSLFEGRINVINNILEETIFKDSLYVNKLIKESLETIKILFRIFMQKKIMKYY